MHDQATLAAQLRRLVTLDVSEEAEDALISEISANVSDPGWMDHIFHSDAFVRPDGSFDADAASAHILTSKPLTL